MKVALVHDWLTGYRGGEKVLAALCELFPKAPIYTLFYRKGSVGETIESHPIHASGLNRLLGVNHYYRYLLPLLPSAIERFDLTDFDLVISSSHCVAKGVLVRPTALHVCYCHTPMRYAWDRYSDYFPPSLKEKVAYPFIHYLRLWDVTSSHRVDRFLTNAEWVSARIEKFYRRKATVIHPFVDVDKFKPIAGDLGEYYLVVSAFAPYKRLDLAIEACSQLGRKLFIVGSGQDEAKLRRLAGPKVSFLGKLGEDDVALLYAGARALLFPGEEDFGIAPLESMSCGRPVIAFGRGGVLETVVPSVTGLFFGDRSADSLCRSILDFENNPGRFTVQACRERAMAFSRQTFVRRFEVVLETILDEWFSREKTLDSKEVKGIPLS